jgi:hypothetical protein
MQALKYIGWAIWIAVEQCEPKQTRSTSHPRRYQALPGPATPDYSVVDGQLYHESRKDEDDL